MTAIQTLQTKPRATARHRAWRDDAIRRIEADYNRSADPAASSTGS